MTLPFAVKFLLEVAAGVAAWFGGFELLKLFFADANSRVMLALIYVLATAVVLAGVLLWREFFASRKEKYANVTPYVEQAAQVLLELQAYMREHEPPQNATAADAQAFFEVCKTKIGLFLDQLNLTFVSLTGTHCRASVKLVTDVDGVLHYYTLVRDTGSEQKCREMDNRRTVGNHDPLRRNGQFSRLLDDSNSSWHYFCNNLLKATDFSSTSFTAYDATWGETGTSSSRRFWQKSVADWPLPYRSTIACAIKQSPGRFVNTPKTVVLGFVTVDSESRNVFRERWDVPIVAAASHALYHPLKIFLEIQNRVNQIHTVRTQTTATELPSRLAEPPPGTGVAHAG